MSGSDDGAGDGGDKLSNGIIFTWLWLLSELFCWINEGICLFDKGFGIWGNGGLECEREVGGGGGCGGSGGYVGTSVGISVGILLLAKFPTVGCWL